METIRREMDLYDLLNREEDRAVMLTQYNDFMAPADDVQVRRHQIRTEMTGWFNAMNVMQLEDIAPEELSMVLWMYVFVKMELPYLPNRDEIRVTHTLLEIGADPNFRIQRPKAFLTRSNVDNFESTTTFYNFITRNYNLMKLRVFLLYGADLNIGSYNMFRGEGDVTTFNRILEVILGGGVSYDEVRPSIRLCIDNGANPHLVRPQSLIEQCKAITGFDLYDMYEGHVRQRFSAIYGRASGGTGSTAQRVPFLGHQPAMRSISRYLWEGPRVPPPTSRRMGRRRSRRSRRKIHGLL